MDELTVLYTYIALDITVITDLQVGGEKTLALLEEGRAVRLSSRRCTKRLREQFTAFATAVV